MPVSKYSNMAKLDEIAELLTEELHDFKKNVGKLRDENIKLENIELVPDKRVLEDMLRDYHSDIKKTSDQQIEAIRLLKEKLAESYSYPKWMVKVFWICIFLNLLTWVITLALLFDK